jgi:hypothetical protein
MVGLGQIAWQLAQVPRCPGPPLEGLMSGPRNSDRGRVEQPDCPIELIENR